jgi:hypothetical protein
MSKRAVSKVPLADGVPSGPGSVRSHDREGVTLSKCETAFMKLVLTEKE